MNVQSVNSSAIASTSTPRSSSNEQVAQQKAQEQSNQKAEAANTAENAESSLVIKQETTNEANENTETQSSSTGSLFDVTA